MDCLLYFLIIVTQSTISLNMIKAIWLVIYLSKIVLWEKLVSLRACMLAKYISHIEEIWEYLMKEKIQRVLHLKNETRHRIKEFALGPESLVLIKNLAIELLADMKMKPWYLGQMIVIRWLNGGGFVLTQLDSSV